MIDGVPIVELSAQAVLAIAVLMLLSGRLFSKTAWQDKADECEKWRQAYEAERKARAMSDSQTVELLELAKTTHSIMVAIFSNSEIIRKSGGEANVYKQIDSS